MANCKFPKTILAVLLGLTLGFSEYGSAQELQSQAAPFTAWLDFKALANPDAPRPPLPIWLESVQVNSTGDQAQSGVSSKKTTYRLRLRNFAGLNDQVMLRVYFTDQQGAQPVVSSWTEIGEQVGDSKTLGSGVGLATSETVILPTKGVDYVEIETPGDGSNVRGALVASLKDSTTKQATDFDSSNAGFCDPFNASTPATPSQNDTLLFGRVKATLDSSVVKLSGTDSNLCAYEFALAHQPLVAVLSFELLNADPTNIPTVSVNDAPLGAVSMNLPDLADPAYRGTVRALQSEMQFHYTGWIKCQKVIPGSNLQAGNNKALIQTGNDSSGFAIRSVEIQLKYNAQTLDYDLKP